MSQRALGALFSPPVTTQFISNLERGVTPLPPMHVPMLSRALVVSEKELMLLLEEEYAQKLSQRLGKPEMAQVSRSSSNNPSLPALSVEETDLPFMKRLYEAYRVSDPKTKEAFATACASLLPISK